MNRQFLLFSIFSPLSFSLFQQKISDINLQNNLILRLFDEQRIHRIGLVQVSGVSKLFINKSYILIDEIFVYLSYFSPRLYFRADYYFPFLFFFWIMGIAYLIKTNNYKIFILSLLLVLPGFLVGKKNLLLIFPVSYLYLYISYLGIKQTKYSNFIFFIFLILNIFLIFRFILI